MKISKKILLAGAISIFSTFTLAAELVTTQNYTRAETDMQLQDYSDKYKAFGKFAHSRKMYDVTQQITIRANTDTLYSFGVFDLTQDATLVMPKTTRYQSAMIVSQDNYTYAVYEGTHTITQKEVGTKYVIIIVRTFVDPNDASDLKKAHLMQDKITLTQKAIGTLDLPDWDRDSLTKKRKELLELANMLEDSKGMFGKKGEVNPVLNVLGAAMGWGGLPDADASYDTNIPKNNDGKIVHTLTVKDVPVDGFWSVTVYNKGGFFDINKRGLYSLNNKTTTPNTDGSATIQFGDCESGAKNCLDIMPGWNYVSRMYRPQESILNGSWKFPKAHVKK